MNNLCRGGRKEGEGMERGVGGGRGGEGEERRVEGRRGERGEGVREGVQERGEERQRRAGSGFISYHPLLLLIFSFLFFLLFLLFLFFLFSSITRYSYIHIFIYP